MLFFLKFAYLRFTPYADNIRFSHNQIWFDFVVLSWPWIRDSLLFTEWLIPIVMIMCHANTHTKYCPGSLRFLSKLNCFIPNGDIYSDPVLCYHCQSKFNCFNHNHFHLTFISQSCNVTVWPRWVRLDTYKWRKTKLKGYYKRVK